MAFSKNDLQKETIKIKNINPIKRYLNSNNKNSLQLFLLLLPGLIIFATFTIYPIIKLFIMSFCNWNIGIGQVSKFVGFQNYKEVFTDSIFKIALQNTIMYAVITVPVQIIIGLFVAILINSIPKVKVTFRILYYLPVISSWVIVSLVFKYLFNNEGFLNYLLRDVFKIVNNNIKWLDTRTTGMMTAEILGIWKGVGWNMIVFLAALQCIPKEFYEAAEIDGAGKINKFIYITLPSIKETILFTLVMLSIGAFNVFTSIKLMTKGGPAHQTEVLLTWMYHKAFEARQFGYSAALSYIIAMVIAVITIIQFRFFNSNKATRGKTK